MSDRLGAAIYSTFNATNFSRLLANDVGEPAVDVLYEHSLLPGAAFSSGGLPAPAADICVVATTADGVLPAIAGLLSGSPLDPVELDREVDAYVAGIRTLAADARVTLASTWLTPPRYSGGVLALDPCWGLDGAVARANRRAVEALRGAPGCFVLNGEGWQRILGERAFSAKGSYLTKDPYAFDLWRLVVADLKAALAALGGKSKKLVILDLDNTLWGGEIGDVGLEGLRLGGHDARGEAYRAFQREVLALGRRGVVLAVASKNDENVALAAFDRHPEMLLRRDDLAGWRINWEDKAKNIAELCSELELSPADAVFIDDNPGERRAAAAALPELTVPEWPANPMLFVDALRRLNLFDVIAVTEEDVLRSRSYIANRMRNSAGTGAAQDAQVRIDIAQLADADVVRTLQLLNKTNQMNLTTRRFTEAELRAFRGSEGNEVWTARVTDRFADYGLTGAFALRFSASECTLTDFVMSCRVLSRGVEERMLECARAEAAKRGCARLRASFVQTSRNEPMRRFLVERSGMHDQGASHYVDILSERDPSAGVR
jgi:FkbH-like protein